MSESIFSDNAHIAQSRLILLDATLIFFMSLTMYSYVRFKKLRYMYDPLRMNYRLEPDVIHCRSFSPEWWGWLLATGTFMACTWASKVNGILTVVAVGIAVLIDLWDILDVRNSMVSGLLTLGQEHYSIFPVGPFPEALRCTGNRLHTITSDPLSILFLDPPYYPDKVRHW